MLVSVCDENGKELEGYQSVRMFGDSVDRHVIGFEKSLQKLAGTPVRLQFELHDCDLYSFVFS